MTNGDELVGSPQVNMPCCFISSISRKISKGQKKLEQYEVRIQSESYRFGDRKTGHLEVPLEYTTYHSSGIVVLLPTNMEKNDIYCPFAIT